MTMIAQSNEGEVQHVKTVGCSFTLWVLPSFNKATHVSRAKRKSSSALGPRPVETNTSMLLRTMSISALGQNEDHIDEQQILWAERSALGDFSIKFGDKSHALFPTEVPISVGKNDNNKLGNWASEN